MTSRNGSVKTHSKLLSSDLPELHNPEIEQGFLGAVLIDRRVLDRARVSLKPEHFFLVKHRWIYETMLKLADAGRPVNNFTVADDLRQDRQRFEDIGQDAYIGYLSSIAPLDTYVDGTDFGKVIEAFALRRRMVTAAQAIVQKAHDHHVTALEISNEVQQLIYNATSTATASQITPQRIAVEDFFSEINRRENLVDSDEPVGTPTGYDCIDAVTGGLLPGRVSLLAARSEHGKTSFTMNVIANIMAKKVPVGFFSLEMDLQSLIERFVGIVTGVNTQIFIVPEQLLKHQVIIAEAQQRIKEWPLYYDTTPAISASDLEAKARLMVREYGIKAIFVDYIQMMGRDESQGRDNQESVIAHNIARLKQLAKDLNIHVWALAQVNRELFKRQDKRPRVEDLRYSDALMHTSDTIWLWHTPCMIDGEEARPPVGQPASAYLFSGKNRGGPKLDSEGVRFWYYLHSQKITEANSTNTTRINLSDF